MQWQRRIHLHLQLHLQFQHRGDGPEDLTSHWTDTTAELAEGARPGHLIVDMAFYEKSMRKKEKKLRQAKRELCQMQLKVWRLEKLASKYKTPECRV